MLNLVLVQKQLSFFVLAFCFKKQKQMTMEKMAENSKKLKDRRFNTRHTITVKHLLFNKNFIILKH